MNQLSSLQAHTLGVLADTGVADAEEIARHLLVDGRSLGPVLRGLEHRGMVERAYTGHRYSRHAYCITDRGVDAYESEFGKAAG